MESLPSSDHRARWSPWSMDFALLETAHALKPLTTSTLVTLQCISSTCATEFLKVNTSTSPSRRFSGSVRHSARDAVPGVLVERDCTHPFENDFYLVSHRALQGTARPIHYTRFTTPSSSTRASSVPDELIDWIYASCYPFVRSTTPVFVHSATATSISPPSGEPYIQCKEAR